MTAEHAFVLASAAVLGAAAGTAVLALSLTKPRVLLYVMFAMLPTQFLFVRVADFYLSPADGLVAGAVAGLLWRLGRGKRTAWTALWEHRFLALMAFAYVIGFVVLGVFSRTIVRLVIAVVPSLLACELLRTRQQIARAAVALAAGGVIDALYGVAVTGPALLIHPGRFAGINGANFSALVIACAAAIAWAAFGRTTRLAVLLVPATLTAAALATLSQMGVLALLAAWWTVLRHVVTRENMLRFAVAGAVLLAIVFTQAPLRDRVLGRNEREVQLDGVSRNSADVRLMVLGMIWHGFAHNPVFGVGYGQFQPFSTSDPRIYASTGGVGYGTHNTYLEVLVEGGVLAFVPLLLHFRRNWPGLRLARQALSSPGDAVVAMAIVGIPIVLVSALLANVLLFYNVWAVCGLAQACGRLLVSEQAHQTAPALVPVGATA